jgi:protein phosphatase
MYEQELRAAERLAEQMATDGRRCVEAASVPAEMVRAAGAVGAVALHASSARGQLRLVPHPNENENGNFPEIELAQIQEKPADLEVGVGLHTGFHRKDAPNEDALFEIHGTRTAGEGLQQIGLFVVADGMGRAGIAHEASRLAIATLCAVMAPALSGSTESVCASLLKEGVLSANLAVYRRNRELAERKTGTSMTAALMLGSIVSIASVGNSRAYLYRQKQGLLQVTQDHTIAAIRGLAVSAQGKHTAARQGILERYLGRQALVEVDLFTVNIRAGDILMLCSRGLWGMVGDAELAQILATPGQHPSQLSSMLVQQALNYGGVENISVIVVRCPAGQDEE